MIVVGTTLATMAMTDPRGEAWRGWLLNAEQLAAQTDEEVWFFAAIEVDGRGLEPFQPLLDELERLNVAGIRTEYWTFSLDDGRTEVNFSNRLRHITMGQNLVTDYAQTVGASHLLFMAADCAYPGDALSRMLALETEVVGGQVNTYGLDGPRSLTYDPSLGDIREHMPTAAFVLLSRDFFRFHRWRWDLDAGMSDDPAMYFDAVNIYGVQPVVMHDVVGRHYPEAIGDYPARGYNTEVVW